jgi:DUF4097 and DUF4098 domain-containing protein YvlB
MKFYERFTSSILWAVLLCASLGLQAAPVKQEKTFKMGLNPHISIENPGSGRLVVQGWDKSEAKVTVVISSEKLAVDMHRMPSEGPVDRLRVAVGAAEGSREVSAEKADFIVKVPSEVQLEIKQRAGTVNAEMLWGDISIVTVAGNVTTTDVGGHVALRSMSGELHMVRPTGRVEAETIGGNVFFSWPESSRVYAQTMTGKISYEGDFAPRGHYRFRSHSGDIEVICPGSSAFDLETRSVRGKVKQDADLPRFPGQQIHLGPVPPTNILPGSHQPGNASVQISTFNGTIHVRRQQ